MFLYRLIAENSPSVSAIFAGVSALIAILALRLQVNNIRHARSIDLILKFEDRFDNAQFKHIRSATARSIMNTNYPSGTGKVKTEINEEVFDFFETLGLMFRRYKLDEELVWNTFFEWVRGYWQSAEKYIAEEQRKDPEVWREFEHLYRRLMKVNEKRMRISNGADRLPDTEIAEFLIREAKLWSPGELV